jgi:multiple sugar transport system permease protein
MQRTAAARPIQTMRDSRRRENIAGYLFMAPSLMFFLGFVIYPMVMCVVYSFSNYTLSEFTFAGLSNYKRMLGDAIFGKALVNTIVIVLVSVPVTCMFSLWVASLIYKMRDRHTSFFRCVFYLPVVTGSVAVTVVWKWIFNNYYGVLNYVFKNLGLITRNINWLGNPDYALACIITILLTTSVGQPIVLYVSALSNVDHSLIEAASVDGATNMQVFWKIKWPQVMPTTLYILVITTINSFQCFALIQLLTSGGPNNSTQTIMYYIYYNAFKLSRYGYGSAMGIILAIIIAVFSAIQFRLAKTDNG